MKFPALSFQLSIIAAIALLARLCGVWLPEMDFLGDVRFIMLCALLIILSAAVITARVPALARIFPVRASSVDRQGEENQWCSPVSKSVKRLAEVIFTPLVFCGIILLVLLLRAFVEVSAMYSDEGIWSYIAHVWVRFGLPPYAGAIENKTPGIFYIFALGECFTGVGYIVPRLLGAIATALTAYGIFRIGERLYSRIAGQFAMIFFGFTSTCDALSGMFLSQVEHFMLPFSVLAAWLILDARHKEDRRARLLRVFFAGCSLGMAIVFKQVALLTIPGLFCFYLGLRPQHAGWKTVARDAAAVIAGIIIATAASLIPLLASHVSLAEYWSGAWGILFGAGSSATGIMDRVLRGLFIMESPDMQLYLPIALLLIVLRHRMMQAGVLLLGLLGWFIFDLTGAGAAGSFSGHQVMQILPSLAILAGVAMGILLEARLAVEPIRPLHSALVTLTVGLLWFPIYNTHTWPPKTAAVRDSVAWLKSHSSSDDYIYVISTDILNPVLALSERRSSSKYFTQYFWQTTGVEEEVQREFAAHPPRYIVMELDRKMSYLPKRDISDCKWLEAMLRKSYRFAKKFSYDFSMRKQAVLIYERIPSREAGQSPELSHE